MYFVFTAVVWGIKLNDGTLYIVFGFLYYVNVLQIQNLCNIYLNIKVFVPCILACYAYSDTEYFESNSSVIPSLVQWVYFPLCPSVCWINCGGHTEVDRASHKFM